MAPKKTRAKKGAKRATPKSRTQAGARRRSAAKPTTRRKTRPKKASAESGIVYTDVLHQVRGRLLDRLMR